MKYYTIGQIVKPQGIKGEVKVIPLTNDAKRFKSLQTVFIDKKEYKIIRCNVVKDGIILLLEGINTRNDSELFRNKMIEISENDELELEEDEYFIVDLIGCKVFIEDELLGILQDIDNYGSKDIFTIKKSNGKFVRMPRLESNVKSIDIDAKIIVLDRDGYNATSVED